MRAIVHDSIHVQVQVIKVWHLCDGKKAIAVMKLAHYDYDDDDARIENQLT